MRSRVAQASLNSALRSAYAGLAIAKDKSKAKISGAAPEVGQVRIKLYGDEAEAERG